MKRLMFTAIASSLALSGAAFGAAMPAEMHFGNVTYVTGGIGKTEADAMRDAASGYPLALMFSRTKEGHFITNVSLRIQAQDGLPVLATDSAGPIVLAKLPEGRYLIEAKHDGRTLVREVEIDPGMHKRVYLNWSD